MQNRGKFLPQPASNFSRRIAWFKASIGFVGSAIPLGLKGLANFVNGVVTMDGASFKEARRNAVYAAALPIVGGITAVASILSPSIGGSPLRERIFSARKYFLDAKQNLDSLPMGATPKKINSQSFSVDVVDIPCETESSHTRILFCGQGGFYEYY